MDPELPAEISTPYGPVLPFQIFDREDLTRLHPILTANSAIFYGRFNME